MARVGVGDGHRRLFDWLRRKATPYPSNGGVVALVHESVSASRLASARDSNESFRSRGRRHGREEVEPSQRQVQDALPRPELARLRTWSEGPRRRHHLVQRRGGCRVDSSSSGLRGGQRQYSNLARQPRVSGKEEPLVGATSPRRACSERGRFIRGRLAACYNGTSAKQHPIRRSTS